VRCHGPEGHGDGAEVALLKTPPRDLAVVLSGQSDDIMRRSIAEGIAGAPMTGFGPILTARELDSLVAYVRTLAVGGTSRETSQALPAQLVRKLEHAGFIAVPIRKPAPRLDIRDANGRTTSLASLRGALVLIVFWETTCAPCLNELPDLEQLAYRFRASGLVVLPVCLDRTLASDALAIAAARAENLPVYVDADGFARLNYDVRSLSAAVLIDRSGRLLASAQGAKQWAGSELQSLIATSLDAP
jgi:peroxiredoxin